MAKKAGRAAPAAQVFYKNCVINPEEGAVTRRDCEELSMLAHLNRRCVAVKCASPARACSECVRQKLRPNQVADPGADLCEFHLQKKRKAEALLAESSPTDEAMPGTRPSAAPRQPSGRKGKTKSPGLMTVRHPSLRKYVKMAPLELLEMVDRMKGEGMAKSDIRLELDMSSVSFNHLMRIARLSPEVRALLSTELPPKQRLTMLAASIIAGLRHELQLAAAQAHLDRVLTRPQLEDMARKARNRQK